MKDDLKEYFKNMFKDVDENIVLDDDQINAITNDDKYTLVLAGAGTGKTTTMTGKVKYLVDIKNVDPSKILVISYTKKAVEELEDLLIDKFNINTNVTTFHSLAYKYVRDIFKNKKCAIIDFNKREEIFVDYINDKFLSGEIKEIVEIFNEITLERKSFYANYFYDHYLEYNNYNELFKKYKEYKHEEAVKRGIDNVINGWITRRYNDDEFIITIKGELVKSLGEAVIANFLYMHGIDYAYEQVYEEIIDERKIYRPDFTLDLAGEKVYLEYFGMDGTKYTRIKNKKIQMHEINKNKFFYIEEHGIRNIEKVLDEKLQKMGFIYRNRTKNEIYDTILENNKLSMVFNLKNLFYECVDKIKENVHREDYISIVENYLKNLSQDEKEKCEKQFKYINDFYVYYSRKTYGGDIYYFDFSDLMHYANKYIKEEKYLQIPDYDYIVIDEYQDISDGEYDLARKSSNRTNAKVFSVGDDWQSIYSFRGSNIGYITKFDKYFENPTILSIRNTYRNSQELVDIAGDFITKNKDQINKELVSYKHLNKPIIFVPYDDNDNGKIDITAEYSVLKRLILKIHEYHPEHRILILGRTNANIDYCFKFDYNFIDGFGTRIKIEGINDLDMDGMTIHKSKGLTYDEVIIIGLNSSFPNVGYNGYWIYNLFGPNVPQESIEFAEERRVFYVALTRTKNNVFILDNQAARNRSIFVDELKRICQEHNQLFIAENMNIYPDDCIKNDNEINDVSI